MIGVEFTRSDADSTPDPERRDQVVLKCFENGLLLLGCGESTVRFCPPLIVTREEVATAMTIFDAAIRETA